MLQEYFVQLGVIIFPICIYQIYAFGKSSDHFPYKTWVTGLYGGGSAILCQLMPLHIMGQSENFQCVPILLSILYGKRKAGALAIAILSLYQFLALPQMSWFPSIAAILVYSAIPMVLCLRFDNYTQFKRFLFANFLSVVTLGVQWLFLIAYFFFIFGANGLNILSNYFNFLVIASCVQLLIVSIAMFLLEHITEVSRIRKRHESLIQYNPLGITAFDMENRFITVNAAYEKITGYSKSELLGRQRLDLWFMKDYDFAQEILDDLSRGEIQTNVEFELRHKDGHAVPVRCTIVPMKEGDRMVGFFSILTDVSEERHAEEALRSSEKLSAVGQLAAGVAHEIRNPLTAIKGFIQLLSRSASPSQSNHYAIIKNELSRIEGIIGEMLVLAKPNAVTFQLISIKEKLQEVVNLTTGEANMQGVEIETDFHEDDLTMMGDGNQLKQVFLNVIKNAIEAMPHGGTLCISLSLTESIDVSFTDTGIGIPEEVLDRIGDPFFSTKATGTGLGFLVSKRIIANHGGSVHIRSVLGEGTTISMSFPIHSGSQESIVETLIPVCHN